MQEPSLKVVEEYDAASHRPVGLVDGGHVILACDDCQAALVDVWITSPSALDPCTGQVFEWRLRAACPFCQGQSLITEVRGSFYHGGVSRPKEDDVTDGWDVTTVDPPEVEDGVFRFPVRKAFDDVQPIHVRR